MFAFAWLVALIAMCALSWGGFSFFINHTTVTRRRTQRGTLTLLLAVIPLVFFNPPARAGTSDTSAPATTPAPTWNPSTWQPVIWHGPLLLASYQLTGGKFVQGPSVSAGYAGYIPLPIPNLSITFGGAFGHSTAVNTYMLQPYGGVGWGGDSKTEPSFQVGICPALLVYSVATGFRAPSFALCTAGVLPLF
jgi:hypothetical protein